jgi:putative ATP-dependent endonuclease of OLD family
LQRFRGFAEQVIFPSRHVVVVGEPRAGRTDLITALRRVLDPRGTARAPDLSDLHRPLPDSNDGDSLPVTEVEVTVLGLGSALEQALYDRLELIDTSTGLPASEERAADGQLGVRVCYRVFFDDITGEYEHTWEYPATGLAPAENSIRAGQAARSYSLRIPPRRWRLRMSRRAICSGSLIGRGSGWSGRALAIPWWGRCPL